MRSLLCLCLGNVVLFSAVGAADAAPKKRSLGQLRIDAFDAKKDVYFERVRVWRAGCDLLYRLTYRRSFDHPIKFRLLLTTNAGPASTPTEWIQSAAKGKGKAEGKVTTPNCWAKKARRLKKVNTEVVGVSPRRAAADGKEFLGKVTFNRWGAPGDVYYRHIQIWKKDCAVHYQFLYKRHNAKRRRLKLRLTLDAGTVKTDWFRSKRAGWREIVGSLETPGCWAKQAKTLKTSGFESERY